SRTWTARRTAGSTGAGPRSCHAASHRGPVSARTAGCDFDARARSSVAMHIRRIHLLASLPLALSLALPAAAVAKRSQFTMFQATREVRSADPAVRAETL